MRRQSLQYPLLKSPLQQKNIVSPKTLLKGEEQNKKQVKQAKENDKKQKTKSQQQIIEKQKEEEILESQQFSSLSSFQQSSQQQLQKQYLQTEQQDLILHEDHSEQDLDEQLKNLKCICSAKDKYTKIFKRLLDALEKQKIKKEKYKEKVISLKLQLSQDVMIEQKNQENLIAMNTQMREFEEKSSEAMEQLEKVQNEIAKKQNELSKIKKEIKQKEGLFKSKEQEIEYMNQVVLSMKNKLNILNSAENLEQIIQNQIITPIRASKDQKDFLQDNSNSKLRTNTQKSNLSSVSYSNQVQERLKEYSQYQKMIKTLEQENLNLKSQLDHFINNQQQQQQIQETFLQNDLDQPQLSQQKFYQTPNTHIFESENNYQMENRNLSNQFSQSWGLQQQQQKFSQINNPQVQNTHQFKQQQQQYLKQYNQPSPQKSYQQQQQQYEQQQQQQQQQQQFQQQKLQNPEFLNSSNLTNIQEKLQNISNTFDFEQEKSQDIDQTSQNQKELLPNTQQENIIGDIYQNKFGFSKTLQNHSSNNLNIRPQSVQNFYDLNSRQNSINQFNYSQFDRSKMQEKIDKEIRKHKLKQEVEQFSTSVFKKQKNQSLLNSPGQYFTEQVLSKNNTHK